MVTDAVAAKGDALLAALRSMPAALVAFSGGVDSSYLAAVAHRAIGDRALAVTAVSPSLARRELEAAAALARRFGWRHRIVATHEIRREEYARNDPDRCYWCKTELFEVLQPIAAEMRADILVGTNADDLAEHRPGGRAATERGVRAPLVEVGLGKAEIRELSARLGLPTAERPASPCLASRVAYGIPVTAERLRRIERAEDFVRSLGFDVLRVRDHGDLARIEVPLEEIERIASVREEIAEHLSNLGFRYVTVDLGGFRSGSLNEVLAPPRVAGA